MARRMSCSMTIDAVRDRTKTVTRRHVDTWRTLKPGDRLILIEKGMGLPKGAKQVVLAEVEVVDVRVEPITLLSSAVRYGRQEVTAEGFDDYDPVSWVDWWCDAHGVPRWDEHNRHTLCRRIEWRYVEDSEP